MANTYLKRTQSGTPTDNKKATISVWVKLAKILGSSDAMGIFGTHDPSDYNANGNSQIGFYNGGLYAWYKDSGSTYYKQQSTRLLRDPNSWYHLVYRFDTTQASGGDRIKVYVNGEEITSFAASSGPPQNSNIQINNSGRTVKVGLFNYLNGTDIYFDGCMSHFHFCDGYSYAPTEFGETDSTTGEWKIKTSPSVSYGTNGFWWLKDSIATTDHSPNSNTFTVGGGTLTKTEDCPSNVFATLNPLDYSPNPATLQNGNTTYNKSSTGSGNNASMTGTLGVMTGKWYYEFKPTNTSSFATGMIRTNHDLPNGQGYYATDAGSYSITNSGKIVGGSESSVSYSYSANDIFGMAYDLDNGKFYFHVNGTYINSGDPTSGSTGTGSLGDIALGSNIYVPFVSNSNYDQTNLMQFNFGNGYFGTTAVSSAGTNASNNGIFEYDVPTGYTALSTKGLNL